MKARRLRHVIQKNRSSGCGPAAVAILAGVTYEEGRLAMFPDGRTKELLSGYHHVRLALKRLNMTFKPAVKRVNVWGAITELAIVCCTENGSARHWVIYDPTHQVIYDPGYSKPMHALFSRQRPISYMAVDRVSRR